MSTRKYLIKKSLMTMFATCCVMVASAGTPPFFTTDVVLNTKGELLMAQKGTSRLDVFSPDGKSLLRSYPLAESPTGVLVDGDKAYVTTFGKMGHLRIGLELLFLQLMANLIEIQLQMVFLFIIRWLSLI